MLVPKDVWDFGTVSQGEEVSHKFQVFNTGEGALRIQQVRAMSPRTSATAASHIVESGQSTEVEVTLRPGQRRGRVVEAVFVHSNDPKEPRKRLMLRGTIK